ncbi:MAG: putative inorganic carbon transporter subunit DabA [Alphaproteobacteria bacterium]
MATVTKKKTTKTVPKRAISAKKRHEQLLHAVHHTAHMLSEQGPMNITFVHNNTLLGLQKKHFHDAIATAKQTLGLTGYMADSFFLDAFARERISEADLDESLGMQTNIENLADEIIKSGEHILPRSEVIKAIMRTDAATQRDFITMATAFNPEAGLLDLGPEEENLAQMLEETGKKAIEEDLKRLGHDRTLGEWLQAHFHLPVMDVIAETIATEHLSAETTNGSHAIDIMKIPSELHETYKMRARLLWGKDVDIGLAVEARLVAQISEQMLGCNGQLSAIVKTFNAAPAGYAIRSLRSAICRSLGYIDPIGQINPLSLTERTSQPNIQKSARPLSYDEVALVTSLINKVEVSDDSEVMEALDRVRQGLVDTILSDECLNDLQELAKKANDTELRKQIRKLATYDNDTAFSKACNQGIDDIIASLSSGKNMADIVYELTGIDVVEKVNASMIRFLASFCDEGLASLRMPDRRKGLFSVWRQVATSDPLLMFEAVDGWRDSLEALPEKAEDAVLKLLKDLGIKQEDEEVYLGRCLVHLRGWAGMMFWMEIHPNHYKQKVQPADLLQYLAARLFTEQAVTDRILQDVCGIRSNSELLIDWLKRNGSEVLLRKALYGGRLPADLAEQAALVLAIRPTTPSNRTKIDQLAKLAWQICGAEDSRAAIAQDITRISRVATQIGLSDTDLEETPTISQVILREVDSLSSQTISRTWLEAYELHYRDGILNALSQNKGKGRWINGRDRRPCSQVVFCIDEREENLHRYYSELDPEHETLGAAGFFGVAIAHSPLGGHDSTPLCPGSAVPAHRVAEVPRDDALDTVWPIAQKRSAIFEAFDAVMWEAKRNPIVAFATVQLTGLFYAIPLLGRVFSPLGFNRAEGKVSKKIIPSVPTRLTHMRVPKNKLERLGLHAEDLPFGFTVAEGADRIETQLRNWGLTYQFAPIVVICAHRSFSVNNPHENAHDCGACGGKAGGPNGRLFAALSNDPEVRKELANRGIDIPDDTWFVGAEHNTCNDDILFYDIEDIPASLSAEWKKVHDDLEEAARRAARERCRRFSSAPKDVSPEKSWAHVKGRSQDLSQVRPEWGHATNAFALVGRRALTEGLFFDRRGFVISYDPTQDADGTILERILLSVGPVGAGINLEYYFSTVNPDGYGAGTKVPHNVVGMIGVMAGAQSDLATGLPRQMTEVHEAMRLQLIVDAPLATLGEIYGRQPAIQELLDGQWVHLIAHDPETGNFHRFVPDKGFVQWDKPLIPLAKVDNSYEWIRGKHHDFLPSAHIRPPTQAWREAQGGKHE